MKKYIITKRNGETLGIFTDKKSTIDFFRSDDNAYDWQEIDKTIYSVSFDGEMYAFDADDYLEFIKTAIVNNKDVTKFYTVVWP